jgi:hypothetical protein
MQTTLEPYGYAERLQRVIFGSYTELVKAMETEKIPLVGSIEYLDALKDTLRLNIEEDTSWGWSVSKTGKILYDDEKHMSLEDRQRGLASNKDIHRLLKAVGTSDATDLLNALKQCSKGPETAWDFEVTPSGVIIFHNSLMSAREITIEVKIIYRAINEEIIVRQAPLRSDGDGATTIQEAVMHYFGASLNRTLLERAGLLAMQTTIVQSRNAGADDDISGLLDAFPPQVSAGPFIQ